MSGQELDINSRFVSQEHQYSRVCAISVLGSNLEFSAVQTCFGV